MVIPALYKKQSIAICILLLAISIYGQAPKLVLPIGHSGMISCIRFNNDGSLIATGSYDRTCKLWNGKTGSLLRTLNFESLVTSVSFSADSKKIVVGQIINGEVLVVDIATGVVLHRLKKDIWGLSIGGFADLSRDNKKIVAAYPDSSCIIWDAERGVKLLLCKGRGGMVTFLRFSPAGDKFVTASRDSTAAIWDARTGSLLAVCKGHSGAVNSAAFSTDGKCVVTASRDRTIRIWDAATGLLISTINGHTENVTQAVFSPDGKTILSVSEDSTTRIWDTYSGKQVKELPSIAANILSCDYAETGNYAVTASDNYLGEVWNMKQAIKTVELKGYTTEINTAFFSRDEKKIVTADWTGTIREWDATTSQPLYKWKDDFFLTKAYFSYPGNLIISSSFKIWDAKSGQLVRQLPWQKHLPNGIETNEAENLLLVRYNDSVKIFDLRTGTLLRGLPSQCNDVIRNFEIRQLMPDGEKVITFSDSLVKVNNIADGQLLYSINAGDNYLDGRVSPDGKRIIAYSTVVGDLAMASTETKQLVKKMPSDKTIISSQFSSDSKKIGLYFDDGSIEIVNTEKLELVVSIDHLLDSTDMLKKLKSVHFNATLTRIMISFEDGIVKVWDCKTGKEQYEFFAIAEDDFFTITPGGYYQCRTHVAKLLHYITSQFKVISFEQLDVKYNRPDKVLEALGNTDTALIKSYHKAWEKRIKKLGIDTTAFRDGYSVPESDFADRDKIEYDQKKGKLILHIKGIDSAYKLDRFNVWVNEVPLYGQRGISIRKKNINDFDTSVTISLSQGENRIETSISNVNGTESYRMPLLVNYTPAVKQKETTRFIGIGIDQFANDQYNLQYSAKDIRDLSKKLKEKYKEDIIIDTLFNKNVTVENIKALKKQLLKTTENDKVIIAYSGHGMLSKDFDYYLSTYNVNFEKPEQNGLPYDELENLLDSIPSRKKLMLIDACHSGEVDKEDLVTLNASPDSLIKGLKPVGYKQEGQLGLKNSFELMQSLFVNVGKSTGATIISAAAGTQFALERNDLKNGVFTYSILEAMNKYSKMKISELKKIVGKKVEELTNGMQQPTSRNETIAVDWDIW